MAVQIARLERQAQLLDRYLDNPGPLAFDLYHWNEIKSKRGGFLWLKVNHCQTAACAVGLACLSGEFATEGLSFFTDPDGTITPTFMEKKNWEAIESFFGLSPDQAERLFKSTSYEIIHGPEAAFAVAARIRSLIKRSRAGKHSSKTTSSSRTAPAVDRLKELTRV